MAHRSTVPGPPANRGGRRSSAEVRRLLLEAAQELFSNKGYIATTTKEIAERAGVSETLLFRHFSSKQKLFERAILWPFNNFVAQYVEDWEAHYPGEQTPEELFRLFVAGFYDLLREHRELALALAAAQLFEGGPNEVFEHRNSPFSQLLTRIDRIAVAETAIRRYSYDPQVSVRLVVGMILAVTLMEDWLFPRRRRPSRARAINEIVAMMLDGLTHRTVPGSPG